MVSRTELTEPIYAQDFDRDSNTIEVFVGRLRRKLLPGMIETVRGQGYRLQGAMRAGAARDNGIGLAPHHVEALFKMVTCGTGRHRGRARRSSSPSTLTSPSRHDDLH